MLLTLYVRKLDSFAKKENNFNSVKLTNFHRTVSDIFVICWDRDLILIRSRLVKSRHTMLVCHVGTERGEDLEEAESTRNQG